MEDDEEQSETAYSYDFFIDENPDVQERVQRGIAQAATSRLQWSVTTLIQQCFPTLLAQTQSVVEQIQDANKLEKLFLQLASATTEDEVHRILHIQEKQ